MENNYQPHKITYERFVECWQMHSSLSREHHAASPMLKPGIKCQLDKVDKEIMAAPGEYFKRLVSENRK